MSRELWANRYALCNLAAVLKVCIAKRLKSVTATGPAGAPAGLDGSKGRAPRKSARARVEGLVPLPVFRGRGLAGHVTRMHMRQQTDHMHFHLARQGTPRDAPFELHNCLDQGASSAECLQ